MRLFDSRKLLSVGVLLMLATLAVNGATSKVTAVVKDVSFNSIGESLEVKIAASEPTQYTYFELSKPHRLVVDFHGIQNSIGFKEKSIDSAGVERVRTSYFSDKDRTATRIVFDLAKNVTYKISDDGAGVVQVLFGERTTPTQVVGPAFAELAVRMADATEPISVVAGPPVIPQASETNRLPSLPLAVVQAALITAPAPPALEMSPIVAAARSQAAAQAGGPPAQSQYTGEIVSFDLKDVDIKDFFRLIADISGLNVVLDPAVAGTVTFVFKDVPWDQALDIILKNYQLGSELQGNVLRIATNATLQSEENNRKLLREARELSAERITRSFILNYTKADAVVITLTPILTARGSIIQDPRRNALIVTDIATQFTKIEQMVKFLDTPAQQVEIEARLLQANKSFSRELGSQLGFVFGNNSQNSLSGTGSVGTSPFVRTPAPSVSVGGAIPLSVNLPAAGTSGLSFLMGAGTDIILDEIITAAEARGTAKLISRPKVTTQNNQAATVSQGTQIPVQTNQNNTVSVQFVNFSLKLTVTPQITNAGTILLNVQVENSQPDFANAVNNIPSVSTQKAETQILIQDGGTAMIGGILVDTDTNNVSQVPGLGSIPLIGHLFKNTQMVKRTAELLFFITPRIKTFDSLHMTTPAPAPGGQQR